MINNPFQKDSYLLMVTAVARAYGEVMDSLDPGVSLLSEDSNVGLGVLAVFADHWEVASNVFFSLLLMGIHESILMGYKLDIVDFSNLLNFMGLSPSGYDGHQWDYGCHKCLRDSRRAGSELWLSMLPVLYWEPRSYLKFPDHLLVRNICLTWLTTTSGLLRF